MSVCSRNVEQMMIDGGREKEGMGGKGQRKSRKDAPPPLLAPPPAVLRVRSTCCVIELVMSRIPSRTAAASTSNCVEADRQRSVLEATEQFSQRARSDALSPT